MKKIILVGNGGHAKVVKDIILSNGEFEIAGYLDSKVVKYYEKDGYFYDKVEHFYKYKNDYYFVIAIGNNEVREKIVASFDLDSKSFPSLIHSSAVVSDSAKVGNGTVVMPNVTINADSNIGLHTIINTGTIIEHDNTIKDYVHISPNAVLAGGVSVESKVHVAIGAKILPQILIGLNSVVGAGATVTKNVPKNCTVLGTPARPKE
ncbi:acetyltransferase [Staphylococcus arlettae]|uniref:acetyltransferase n=1 Tax=Staphylococcus arlettae TaxID=29378 RepID=UPI003464C5F3